MNQIATTERSTINSVAMSAGPTGSSIAPQSLGDVVRFAEVMCKADIALPKHLRGNAGACMAVALQALEWQMSPFAVASKSYSVNGAIAYEAQLIAAVVNTRSGIKGRLKYFFSGDGPSLTCRVVGILDGEECEYETPPAGSITTKNSPLWKSDPRQQLGYFAARSWARRHCPEVILGVYDRDEADQIRNSENARDVTPSLAERLANARIEQHEARQAPEGFDRAFVDSETAALTSEAAFDAETPSDAGEAAPPADLRLASLMQEAIDKFMAVACDPNVPDPKARQDNIVFAKNAWKDELPSNLDFVKVCTDTANRVVKGDLAALDAREYLEGFVSDREPAATGRAA